MTETNVVVTADYQSAGRGQGTNTWESEKGKNLLFSIKVSPGNILAKGQFVLSMAGALSVKKALDVFADGFSLKWPNDIYWFDRKISGTLIETTVVGKRIHECILGTGINVNQRQFCSNAPNPVSLWQIINREPDCEELLSSILDYFASFYQVIEAGNCNDIYTLYNANLYRRDEFHFYEDRNGIFEAKILGVETNGHIVLSDRSGIRRSYELKELKFII